MDGDNEVQKGLNVAITKPSESFFTDQKVEDCFYMLDRWQELVLTDKHWMHELNPAALILFHDRLLKLIEAYSSVFEQTASKQDEKVDWVYLSGMAAYRVRFLTQEELKDPISVVKRYVCVHDFTTYQEVLKKMLLLGLDSESVLDAIQEVLNTFNTLKKFLEACWLIQCKADIDPQNIGLKFLSTDPALYGYNGTLNPYNSIEEFFGGASLGAYKMELRAWFKAALSDTQKIEKPAALLVFFHQLTELTLAVHLIQQESLRYNPDRAYANGDETFRKWIDRVRQQRLHTESMINWEYETNILEADFQKDALKYLQTSLTIDRIAEIRYGLQKWLYAALDEHNSIHLMEDKYVFYLYEDVEKLMESAYLLITANN